MKIEGVMWRCVAACVCMYKCLCVCSPLCTKDQTASKAMSEPKPQIEVQSGELGESVCGGGGGSNPIISAP